MTTRYFHSGMTGAPTMTGVAGSMIGVLDACLVNGWALANVTIAVAAGVATVTFPSGHPFAPGQVAAIAGATPAALNGDKRALTTSSSTITFAAPGVADGAATGAITAKVSPLGWAKAFSGTNLAAYTSLAPQSFGSFLRVDDTGATDARVFACKTMSDINTYTGRFPTDAQRTGGLYWAKAHNATGTRAWLIVGDERGFYIAVAPNTIAPTHMLTSWFGDGLPIASTDATFTIISGQWVSRVSSAGGAEDLGFIPVSYDTQAYCYAARGYTAMADSSPLIATNEITYFGGNARSGNYSASTLTYPNGPDNGLILARSMVIEQTTGRHIRGGLPGLLHAPFVIPDGTFGPGSRLDGAGAYLGRQLLAVVCGDSNTNTAGQRGVYFLDAFADWR